MPRCASSRAKGFHAARVGDIAEEAGVAHGLLYHYFRSKDEVLETIFRETWRRSSSRRERIEHVGRAAARAAAAVRAHLPRLVARHARPRCACSCARSRAARRSATASTRSARVFVALQRIIEAAKERGEVRADCRRRARGVGRLRRARGDPDGLGARPAAGRGGGRRAGCRDGRRRHSCGARGMTRSSTCSTCELDAERRRPGRASVPRGARVGAERRCDARRGSGVYELAARARRRGRTTSSSTEEEWLIVIAGEVTRAHAGRRARRCAPATSSASRPARRARTRCATTARRPRGSRCRRALRSTASAIVYPDSGKFVARRAGLPAIEASSASRSTYWEGEA